MSEIVGWDAVGIVFTLTVTVALGVLAIGSYGWAKFWTAVSAAILAVKLALVAAPVWPDLGWLFVAYVAIGFALIAGFRKADALELRDSNVLVAGRKPTPEHAHLDSIPADAFLVFLGDNLSWADKLPKAIFEIMGNPILAIDRHKGSKKRLDISLLRLFDEKQELIARVDSGGFWVAGGVRKERPDRSTLVIFDKSDREVMRAEFLNRRTLRLTGVFRYPGYPSSIEITPTNLRCAGNDFSGNSFGGTFQATVKPT